MKFTENQTYKTTEKREFTVTKKTACYVWVQELKKDSEIIKKKVKIDSEGYEYIELNQVILTSKNLPDADKQKEFNIYEFNCEIEYLNDEKKTVVIGDSIITRASLSYDNKIDIEYHNKNSRRYLLEEYKEMKKAFKTFPKSKRIAHVMNELEIGDKVFYQGDFCEVLARGGQYESNKFTVRNSIGDVFELYLDFCQYIIVKTDEEESDQIPNTKTNLKDVLCENLSMVKGELLDSFDSTGMAGCIAHINIKNQHYQHSYYVVGNESDMLNLELVHQELKKTTAIVDDFELQGIKVYNDFYEAHDYFNKQTNYINIFNLDLGEKNTKSKPFNFDSDTSLWDSVKQYQTDD